MGPCSAAAMAAKNKMMADAMAARIMDFTSP